jgi:6-phosphogluconolactonase
VTAEIRILPDAPSIAREAAERFARAAGEALRDHGRFAVALAGGSTPRGLYALLAGEGDPSYRDRVPWASTHVFFGDERAVPPDHPDSNYRMARETLLSRVPVPADQIRRIPAERPDPRAAAAEYERAIRNFFALPPGGRPRFDLILLGLGADGHTASLFPGSPALEETASLVASAYLEPLRSWRITLTLPAINAAARVVFLVSGSGKAEALRAVLRGPDGPGSPPARRVRPADGALTFLADRPAARLL